MKHKVKDIYKGYLDLIQYLEEKFPGCVHAVYVALDLELRQVTYQRKELLVIKPTTTTTRKTFIDAACDRFNLLGSTQIQAQSDNDETWIYTKDLTPVLYTLYRRLRHGATPDQRIIVAEGVRRLLRLLHPFSRGAYDAHGLFEMRVQLTQYEQYYSKGHEESKALWHVYDDCRIGALYAEKQENHARRF